MPRKILQIRNEDLSEKGLPVLEPDLEYLLVRNCQLTELPPLEHLQKLKGIDCSENQLVHLPALPPNLEGLNCIRNQITDLPDLPPKLKDLECTDNQLTYLPDLPPQLEGLSCENNPITRIGKLSDNNRFQLRIDLNKLSLDSLKQLKTHFDDHPRQKLSHYNQYDDEIISRIKQEPMIALESGFNSLNLQNRARSINREENPLTNFEMQGKNIITKNVTEYLGGKKKKKRTNRKRRTYRKNN